MVGSIGADTLLGAGGKDSFFFSKIEESQYNVQGTNTVTVNGETTELEPGESVAIIDGELEVTEDDSAIDIDKDPVDTIDDFDASEGDKIFIDGDSFDVKPGDKSTLKFDSKTEILSLADEPVFKISSGISSEIIENTEIIQSEDSVVIGADGGEVI